LHVEVPFLSASNRYSDLPWPSVRYVPSGPVRVITVTPAPGLALELELALVLGLALVLDPALVVDPGLVLEVETARVVLLVPEPAVAHAVPPMAAAATPASTSITRPSPRENIEIMSKSFPARYSLTSWTLCEVGRRRRNSGQQPRRRALMFRGGAEDAVRAVT
jgi:hypothetical protein